MSTPLRFVFLGLSITSSWGNGHATTYRALLKYLARRGHDVTFLERDLPFYAANRDLPAPPYARTRLYAALEELFDAHARSCGARVLLASTSEVYGDPEVHPQAESYRGWVNTVGPRACYDEGKRCAESLMMDFLRQHGTLVKIARIFNTYGPRMDPEDGRIVSNFIGQALAGKALTIYGDGAQTRSLCYVDDVLDGLTALMEHPDVVGPVNLGNPDELSVLEFAELVQELTGRRCPLAHGPLPEDDPRVRRPVIDVARDKLGFSPRVSLRDGLARTIAGFERAARETRPSPAEAVAFLAQSTAMNRGPGGQEYGPDVAPRYVHGGRSAGRVG